MGAWRRWRERQGTWSLADPAFAAYFGAAPAASGVNVSEVSALGLTAVWRAVNLIAGTCAALPLRTYRRIDDTEKQLLTSFLDDPMGPLTPLPMTPFEWVETVLAHLLLHGNAYLMHVYGGAGQIVGLLPIHPTCVAVELANVEGGKLFTVSLVGAGGKTEMLWLTPVDLTHISGLSTDGLRGISPLAAARNALGSGIAAEVSAGRQFANGLTVSGLVTPEDDMTEAEAKVVKDSLDRRLTGMDNAGALAIVNRRLKVDKLAMSAVDAQFVEQRQFGIAEVSRLYGVPRELLSEAGATSWGSGIQELVRGFLRFTLDPWLTRIEQQLSILLPRPRFVEFDRTALLQGSPQEELDLILAQVDAGLLTIDEARMKLGRPGLPATVAPEPESVSEEENADVA